MGTKISDDVTGNKNENGLDIDVLIICLFALFMVICCCLLIFSYRYYRKMKNDDKALSESNIADQKNSDETLHAIDTFQDTNINMVTKGGSDLEWDRNEKVTEEGGDDANDVNVATKGLQ